MHTSPDRAGSPSAPAAHEVVELRQYTLRPGGRDVLIALFEREFVETQEAVGMRVGGLFLDRDDPNRFVWFRGFPSMAARRRSLAAFYGGPVWGRHGDAANATMLDSDDVLLLRHSEPAHPLPEPVAPRPPVGATDSGREWVVVTVHRHDPDDDVARWLATEVHTALERALGVPVATWRTEPAENDFPRLPVRSDTVFVWSATFADERSYRLAMQAMDDDTDWRHRIRPRLDDVTLSAQHLRLQPTARSRHPQAAPGI